MRIREQEGESNIWIVVADALVGFLAVVFIVGYSTPTRVRPPAIESFETDIKAMQARWQYGVQSEYSKVHITYQERVLFQECEWTLSEEGHELLKEHAEVFWRYIPDISRIQIEGHADSRPATFCASLKRTGLPPDNWLLSSLRAIGVRAFLAAHATELLNVPDELIRQERLRKLEAVGRGDLHPKDPKDPANRINRRIEMTVHFIEPAQVSR